MHWVPASMVFYFIGLLFLLLAYRFWIIPGTMDFIFQGDPDPENNLDEEDVYILIYTIAVTGLLCVLIGWRLSV